MLKRSTATARWWLRAPALYGRETVVVWSILPSSAAGSQNYLKNYRWKMFSTEPGVRSRVSGSATTHWAVPDRHQGASSKPGALGRNSRATPSASPYQLSHIMPGTTLLTQGISSGQPVTQKPPPSRDMNQSQEQGPKEWTGNKRELPRVWTFLTF